MVKYYNKYFLSTLCFLSIILISLLFSLTVLAIPEPKKGIEIDSLKFERQSAIDHVLYRLQIIDITTKNITKINLNKLEYSTAESKDEINLIKQEELLKLFNSELELELENIYEQEKNELNLGPSILVAPGNTARMYVAQEDLFLDAKYTKLDNNTNTFELEVYPRDSFDEDNNIFTTVYVRTGQGTTGLETDVWIKAYQPHLLAIMESSKKGKSKSLTGNSLTSKKRYFALYLSVRPASILTLPDLSTSLAGLEIIFNEPELAVKKDSISLKLVYEENNDNNYGFSLDGFYHSNSNLGFDYKINEILTNQHSIAVMGNLYDNLWLGAELINFENNEFELALKLKDMVEIGPLKLSASINPLSYNFGSNNKQMTWSLRGETIFKQKLNFALEYKYLLESDFADINLVYDINNLSLLLGHIWNLDLEEEKAYWFGVQYNI